MKAMSTTISSGNRARSTQKRPLQARVISACVIAVAHVAVIALLMRLGMDRRPRETEVEPMLAELLAETSDEMPLVDSPSITLEAMELEPPALEIETEAEVPPILAPKLDTEPAADIAAYSSRAELAPGVVATVIVLLEIGPDGEVLSAQVLRSNAGEAANAAALDYARATRWTAGRIDGEPRAMQASLAVILGERA